MKAIYKLINKQLDKNESFVLATILKKSGSAPREEGTKMLIRKDFSIGGTIGGGISEAMTIKLAVKVFENGEYIIEDFVMSNKDAAQSGMICGGDISVLLEYVDCSDSRTVDIYKKAIELKHGSTDFVMITKLSGDNRRIKGSDKWICTETGFYGTENEEVREVAKHIREDFAGTRIKVWSVGKEMYIIEPFFDIESVYIYGAGHVAQKIADITKKLGFYTVVMDDREEFANRERFKTADEVRVIQSFNNLGNYDIIDDNSYIIIVTRGHAYDKDVLAQMLRTDAKYIGMIGSRSKRDYVYNSILNEGFTPDDLKRVHCPIGLNIYAQTPEEIAVSIAAELIKVKRGPQNERR
ncbi:MAG: XdhC family aldehyde oxidoreductase maturation factor [Clostridia bacterium]